MKWVCLVLLCLVVLGVGCTTQDVTEKACTAFKHAEYGENTSIYMDDGLCIMEEEGFDTIYFIRCKRLFNNKKFEMMMKSKEDLTLSEKEEWPKYCEFMKLER